MLFIKVYKMVEKLNIEKKIKSGQEIEPSLKIEVPSEGKTETVEKYIENETSIQKSKSISDDIVDAQQKISSTVVPFQPKSQVRTKLDSVLQENLADIYKNLDEKSKIEFRQKGTETASKIEELIETMKVKAKIVLSLIRDWLTIIPGVNKYFLEQESKIKTDKIVMLAKERKKEIKNKIN